MAPVKLQQHLADVFNRQEYRQVIQLFDQIASSGLSTDDMQKSIYPLWCLKVISTTMLGEDDQTALDEMEQICTSHPSLLAVNCQMLISMQAYDQVVRLQTHSRAALAAKLKVYELLGDANKWQSTFEGFNRLPAHELEQRIKIVVNGKDHVYPLPLIKHFNINKDLPNQNIFIEFTVEDEENLITGCIPGMDNDGICDEGSITLQGSLNRKYSVSRFDVRANTMFSPFGLMIQTDGVTIHIMNCRLLDELFEDT